MRGLLIVLALALGLLMGTADAVLTPGTVTLVTPEPVHYEQPLTFEYHLNKTYRGMTAALICWQGTVTQLSDYGLILEASLPRHDLNGTFTMTVANGLTSLTHRELDYSQPADCMAYIFREPQSANQGGMILTDVLRFTVVP